MESLVHDVQEAGEAITLGGNLTPDCVVNDTRPSLPLRQRSFVMATEDEARAAEPMYG